MEKERSQSHSATGQQFILISGVPGSGKTTFSKYLEKNYGFYFIQTDYNHTELRELCFGDIGNYVTRWLKKHDHMCLEWGFLPKFLPRVLCLKNQGANIFWFTCNKDIALSNYLKAHREDDQDGAAWHRQIERIKNADLPTPAFVKIETRRDGNPIPLEELTAKIISKR
jgi:hypothetical protein